MSRYPVFYSTPPELRDIVVQTFEWPKFWVQMQKKTHPSRTNQNRHGQESEVGGGAQNHEKSPENVLKLTNFGNFQNVEIFRFSFQYYLTSS